MFLTLQFPMADARPFAPAMAGRCSLPDWPPKYEDLHPQFVHFFGPAKRRWRGADAAYTDEIAYCKAKRALRFSGLGAKKYSQAGPRLLPSCEFRRLLSDGRAVVRVEIGIGLARESLLGAGDTTPLTLNQLLECIRVTLSLPSQVPSASGNGSPRALVYQGSPLARLFAHASSMRLPAADAATKPELVEAGLPMLLVELDPSEVEGWHDKFTTIDPQRVLGADVAYFWCKVGPSEIPVWLVSQGKATDSNFRSLRLCLLRLHAELQALDLTLRQYQRGRLSYQRDTDGAGAFDNYLNESTRLIQSVSWEGVDQSAIREALDAATAIQSADVRKHLVQQLNGVRRQVRQKLDDFDRNRGALSAVQIVKVEPGGVYMVNEGQSFVNSTIFGSAINKLEAQTIEGSFNSFVGSNPDDDRRQKVANLHDEVKKLIERLPAGSQERKDAVADLELLTQQMAEKEPNKRALKATGEGLIEAAKKVAEFIEPVSKAVLAVLAIVGVVL